MRKHSLSSCAITGDIIGLFGNFFDEFGGFPLGVGFPYGDAFDKLKRAGEIVELISEDGMREFYSKFNIINFPGGNTGAHSRAGINCALANRQIVAHFCREVFRKLFSANPVLLYDVSHNTCKEEEHRIGGRLRSLFVHRKGATRAFGPGHPALGERFQKIGQPVIIENVPQGDGIVAAQNLIRASADGYNILMASAGPITVNPVLQASLPSAEAFARLGWVALLALAASWV